MPTPTPRYGDSTPVHNTDDALRDEIRRRGVAILPGVLDSAQLEYCRKAIDDQLDEQQRSFGSEELASIGELDIVRAPLVKDDFFLTQIAMAPAVYDMAEWAIGSYRLLHLQNAIVNRPGRAHHQAAWHRDLPYLNRISSSPLAVSALFCIDEFTVDNGATWCLPGSHLVAEPPSDAFLAKHGRPVEANAGDVIVFDSMLMHRAGSNDSTAPRRAVNNVYSVGIVRQQIDLPRALLGRHAEDPRLALLLGYESNAPISADAYRRQRVRRLGSP